MPTVVIHSVAGHAMVLAMHAGAFSKKQHFNEIPWLPKKEIRQLLESLLRTDADLDAFSLDHFEDIHRRYSSGMDRLTKFNLLLTLAEPTQLIEALLTKFRGVDDALTQIGELVAQRRLDTWQVIPLQQARTEQLKELIRGREHARLAGEATVSFDRDIVELKRTLRQGPQLRCGEVLNDRYELIDLAGRGGFAKVWLALDIQSEMLVAVKVLHSDQGEDARRIERFHRGAVQMKRLNHPHIVRVLCDPAEHHGFHYFVMDYLCGGDVHQAVVHRNLTLDALLRALFQIGEALECAHSRGLIHRDVKPQNVLLDETGNARLTDFDLVWAPDTTGGTRTGALGTFLYAAPESMEDASHVDARADVYGLAMITIFMLHGKALPRRILDQRIDFIAELRCADVVCRLLKKATSPDPQERPRSIAEFCHKLKSALPMDFSLVDRNPSHKQGVHSSEKDLYLAKNATALNASTTLKLPKVGIPRSAIGYLLISVAVCLLIVAVLLLGKP